MLSASRSKILIPVTALLAIFAASCSSSPLSTSSTRPKLVILGFDGLDPDLARQWMSEGKLPNMSRLAQAGGVFDLQTTHSPESPTAWASFATGVNPGKHNIYDFLVRDTTTYLPDLGMVRRVPGRFLFNYIPLSPPQIESLRGATSFWVTAGRAGVRSSVLTVPITYPPEDVPNGELLAGLPLPDIRDTMGTFYYFATDLSRYEEGNTEFGGILKRLVFQNDRSQTELIGPPNPIVRQQLQALRASSSSLTEADRASLAELESNQDVRVPLSLTWSRGASGGNTPVTIAIQGETLQLRAGEWSRWIPLEFRINALIRLRGMAQMYVIRSDNDLQLYVSPVNWRPDAPPLPISSPPSLAADLYERLGPYRTLGWAEATWPLEENRLDEQTFLDDVNRTFDDRARVILDRLSSGQWDLFVGVIESTDRVQHMMWRLYDPKHPMYDEALARTFGDAIERIYERSDEFVGEVVKRLDPSTPVLIVSDHGFHSWRKAVNLNTWLVEQGFMMLKGQTAAGENLPDLSGGGQFWEHVDWSRTRAYAMGLGQIYFNLRGREAQGIVNVGAEYMTLTKELSAALLQMRDPETTESMVRNVYTRDEVYSGPFLGNASDLQVGFADGYRVSWQTALGGMPPGVVYSNNRKWSADHGSFDYAETAGVLISSQKLSSDKAAIIDIAPTVLQYFGVEVPTDIDGRPLFAPASAKASARQALPSPNLRPGNP